MPDIRNKAGVRSPTRGQSNKPSVLYPTEDVSNDFLIVERKTVDSKEAPIAYGTAHPTISQAVLVDQKFELEEDGKKTRTRIYSSNGTTANQDAYNYTLKYSQGSSEHQIVIRTYNIRESDYSKGITGTPDSVVTSALLVDEEADQHPEYKGILSVTRVFETLPGPELTGQEVSTEFGGGVLDVTEQTVSAGTSVAGGLRVVSASVKPDSAGKSTLQKVELPSGEDWPTLHESEWVAELGIFVHTEKTVVANTGQTPSLVTSGGFITMTEYRDIDKWRTVRVVSKVADSIVGSTRTFRQPIQYAIPHAIPETPELVKAYRFTPPPDVAGIYDDYVRSIYVDDVAFDFQLVQGYSGPFSATVTRTVSTSSATETEYQWFPAAVQKSVPVTAAYNEAAGSGAKGRIISIQTPAAIHGAWEIEIEELFQITGYKYWEYDDASRSTISDGFPVVVDIGDPGPSPGSPYWRIQVIMEKVPLVISVPATTPAAIPHGSTIIARVRSEEWRFGLWINDVYRIVVP